MPAKLVSKRAIIDLGYPFEEEGSTVIILKALGRENIDEVIKLSEDYKTSEKVMSGGRSGGGEVLEERRTTEEVYRIPPGPLPSASAPQIFEVSPEDIPREAEIVEKTTVERREEIPGRHRSRSVGPVVYETDRREIIERDFPNGPMPMVLRRKDERSISAEIRALEAEKEAIRIEKRAQREYERANRIRTEGRESGELVVYEEKRVEKEKEHDGGVRIEKDKRGPDPRAVRTLLKTLT